MKGIGMLLVVLGHAINSGDVALCKVLWSFHMPLFFFCGALVTRDTGRMSFSRFCLKKTQTLLVPHLTLAISLSLIEAAMMILENGSVKDVIPEILTYFSYWFLPAYFGIEVVKYVQIRLIKSENGKIWALLVECLAFLLCSYNEVYIAQQILAGLTFLDLGEFFRPWLDRVYTGRGHGKIAGVLVWCGSVILLRVAGPLAEFPPPILTNVNQYGDKLLFLIGALMGIFSMAGFSIVLADCGILNYIGRNTIIVYVTHFPLYRVLKWLAIRMVPGIKFSGFPVYWILFFVAMGLEIVIIWVSNRYVPFLFGKKYRK